MHQTSAELPALLRGRARAHRVGGRSGGGNFPARVVPRSNVSSTAKNIVAQATWSPRRATGMLQT